MRCSGAMDATTHLPVRLWLNVNLDCSPPGTLHLQPDLSVSLKPDSDALNLKPIATMDKPDHSGPLSLYQHRLTYRKSLPNTGCIVTDAHGRNRLRRKSGASNLNRTPSASVISSPPPLSPSYSTSVMSQRSELEQDGLDGFLARTSRPRRAQSEYAIHRKLSSRVNVFRDKLRKPSLHGHNKTQSDSLLLDLKQPKATMIHQGTPFEILNPHESLNFARIVSYIEDVDYSPRSSSDYKRESSNSISTMVLKEPEQVDYNSPEKESDNAVPETEGNGGDSRIHSDLVGDASPPPIPSISERLENEESQSQSNYDEYRSLRHLSNPSDLGEPGPEENELFEPESDQNNHPSHTLDAWPMRGEPEPEFRARPISNYQTAPADQPQPPKEGFRRLRRIVRSIPFLRRKRDEDRLGDG